MNWRLLAWGMVLVLALGPAGACFGAGDVGLRISPVLQDVSLPTNRPSVGYSVTIANNTGVDQAFRLGVRDFGSLDESGGVAFLGDPASEFVQSHGLSEWMSLDKSSVTVPVGGKIQVVVTIRNDDKLRLGGHYGVLTAEALTAPGTPASGTRVGVTQVLSSLFLVVKEGSPPPNLRLLSQVLNGNSPWRLPDGVIQRFEDDGDVHVVPRGITTITDPLGRMVERGVMNEDSGNILPGSIRRFQTPLARIARAWVPGRYMMASSYRYDGKADTQTSTSTFWYVGSGGLVIGVVVLLMIVLAGGLTWWLRRR
jgi:hypothetical protein